GASPTFPRHNLLRSLLLSHRLRLPLDLSLRIINPLGLGILVGIQCNHRIVNGRIQMANLVHRDLEGLLDYFPSLLRQRPPLTTPVSRGGLGFIQCRLLPF
ncbi:hypothetical protein PIB30_102406, partial [Stylosanthes scabra]|nr:hypothetical protein [Stylosanthes scabra]